MAQIIMKYDDLSQESLSEFSKVANFSVNNNMPVSMGIIGSSLTTENDEYIETVKRWSCSGIEIWNHGYYHTDEEFSTAPLASQLQSIRKTQLLATDKLGLNLTTFGSPHNNSTETTVTAIKLSGSGIQRLLFAVDGEKKCNLKSLVVRCNMEIKTGSIDFDFFLSQYRLLKDYPYMVVQGHPGFWSGADFNLNERIMLYLRSEGHSFTIPSAIKTIDTGNCLPGIKEAENLIRYAKSFPEIALYGAGEIGREMFRYLEGVNGIRIGAFIVSDHQPIIEEKVCGIQVIHSSDFNKNSNDCAVIMALMPNFHSEVESVLMTAGVNYMKFKSRVEYMRLINYIRLIVSE